MEADHAPSSGASADVDRAPAWSTRSEAIALAIITLAALGLRVLVAARTRVIFDDGPDFIAIARAMARGDFGSALAHPFHPLYSLLIWLTPGSAGSEELAGVVWSVAAGTACVVLVWWLMRPLFGACIAVIAAALLTAHPYAVRISADVQSDTLHLAFFLLGLGLVQRAVVRADAGLAFAAGIAGALAYLTRPEGIGVLVVGVVLAVGQWVNARWGVRRLGAFVAALVGGFALLAIPYMRVIWVLSGEWQLTQKKSIPTLLGIGHLSTDPSTVLAAALLGGVTLAVVVWARRRGGVGASASSTGGVRTTRLFVLCAAAFAGVALVLPAELLRWSALFASTLRPELAILLLVGVAVSAKRGAAPTGRSFFFATTAAVHGAATFALLVSAGYLSRRHLLPLAVVVLGYAALGLYAIAAAAERSGRRASGVGRGRIIVALVLVVVAIALPKTLRSHREEGVASRLAAEWVRGVAAPGDRIATERPRTAYYAGLVFVPIRDAEGLRDGAALRRLGVRWLVAGKRELAGPEGSTFAAQPAPGQVIEFVHETEAHGFRALVFELHEQGH